MNQKILLEIYLPVAGINYDVFVPATSQMSEVILLVGKMFSELAQGAFSFTKETTLCDRETGHILSCEGTVRDLKLHNGSKLMLI